MGFKWLLLLCICVPLFAHKIEGVNLVITPIQNDTIAIEGQMKSSGKRLEGNKVSLISMIDKKVLFEGYLEGSKPLNVKIPEESYWVYMYVGDQDIVEEGMAPKGGFKKIATSQKERASRMTGGMALLFLSLFALTVVYRVRDFKHKTMTG